MKDVHSGRCAAATPVIPYHATSDTNSQRAGRCDDGVVIVEASMPKGRPKPGKCIHCLEHFEELTWDHVFPKAWYPDGETGELEKWVIPSCAACNATHGKSENDLLTRLGLCVDPADPRTAGIADKALRAVTADAGHDEKDSRAREAKRGQLLCQATPAAEIAGHGIFPGFGPHEGFPAEEQYGIAVSRTALEGLTKKIVRGVTYIVDGALIEPPTEIDFYVLDDAGPWKQLLDQHGVVFQRGPGITIRRATATEGDKSIAVYEIEIWGKLKTYASVSTGDDVPN